MRKFFTLISMLTLCLGMGAQTETTIQDYYRIYVQEGPAIQAGSTAQLYLIMDNRFPISIWDCTLVLPEGITYQDVALYTESGCYPEGYNADFNVTTNDDNSVKFTCAGDVNMTTTQKGNLIAVVTVDVPKTTTPGQYEFKVKDITLTEENGSIHRYEKNDGVMTTVLTIEEPVIVYGTITFDLNGAPGEYAPVTVPVGDPIAAPDDPEWDADHVFKGWEPAIPDVMPEGGITVKAIWAQLFNVVVDGEGVAVDNTRPEEGSNVTVTVSELPNQEFVALYVNQEDVTSQMTGNTYVIENVASDYYVWASFKTTSQTISVTQDYTPFSSEYDLDFSGSDVKAYIASGFNTATNQAVLVNVTDVPAFTGVLLIGSKGEFNVPVSTSTSYFVNLFKPFTQGGWLNPYGEDQSVNFVYAEVDGDPGFYRAQEGTPGATPNGIELPANSAYLSLPGNVAGSAVKVGFFIEEDVIDGVTGIEATESLTIFDLQGRRVSKAAKGIYIVNGKKIAVK